MSRSFDDWTSLLERYFQVPGQPIYILGCFARHVTVYSQQVRALNLIAALHVTGVIAEGKTVAIIGGGAAGVMAAAAAAHLKATVAVIDQLSAPVGIQLHNRHRYLHPSIYDWPDPSSADPDAKLPFFPWSAGYAADVAERMGRQFEEIRQNSNNRLTAHWEATDIRVQYERGLRVGWNPRDSHQKAETHLKCDVVIMAVGFGLENDDRVWKNSYWSNDDLDDELHHRSPKPRFLVGGVGDGGLVDVMRLCIRGFRHDKVLTSIRDLDGIAPLGDDLLEIHRQKLTDQDISDRFAVKVQPEEKTRRLSACMDRSCGRSTDRSGLIERFT